MATADQAWGRRLIVCCDGTWQSSVTEKENIPSNVTKFARLIKRIGKDKKDKGKMWHQIVYYDGGVGTGNLSSTEATRQGGTGAGLAENVIEAYNFIVLNWQAGDEIFCFGFSRGAYTARAVAGLVTDIGVIQPNDMQYFPHVYRAYMSNSKGEPFQSSRPWQEFVRGKLSPEGSKWKAEGKQFPSDAVENAKLWEIPPHGDMAASEQSRFVKVIGVWDTVGSLGVPDIVGVSNSSGRAKYGFHNVKLSEYVQHAYHALALDERRKAFRPTLWYIPKEIKDSENKPELKQVWFPGVHINCGGGSNDAYDKMEGDLENISVATLTWMLQCIAPHLDIDQGAFNELSEQYKTWLIRIRYACTYHHEKNEGYIEWLWNKIPDVPFVGEEHDPLKPPRRDPLHEHKDIKFGWGVGPIADSFTKMYALNGTHPRAPGFEECETYNKDTSKFEWVELSKLGETNEYIHPLVFHRKAVVGWHEWTTKHPLTDWERTFDGGRWWWHKKTDSDKNNRKRWLPEWAIFPHADDEINYERTWYNEAKSMEAKFSAVTEMEKVKIVNPFKTPKPVEEIDFLAKLDREVDFAKLPQTSWP